MEGSKCFVSEFFGFLFSIIKKIFFFPAIYKKENEDNKKYRIKV